MKRAQGAMEYLIMIAAVLAIGAVIVLLITTFFSSSSESASISACKQTASSCNTTFLITPDDPCRGCESACAGLNGMDLIAKNISVNEITCNKSTSDPFGPGNATACIFCKRGQPTQIYEK